MFAHLQRATCTWKPFERDLLFSVLRGTFFFFCLGGFRQQCVHSDACRLLLSGKVQAVTKTKKNAMMHRNKKKATNWIKNQNVITNHLNQEISVKLMLRVFIYIFLKRKSHQDTSYRKRNVQKTDSNMPPLAVNTCITTTPQVGWTFSQWKIELTAKWDDSLILLWVKWTSLLYSSKLLTT